VDGNFQEKASILSAVYFDFLANFYGGTAEISSFTKDCGKKPFLGGKKGEKRIHQTFSVAIITIGGMPFVLEAATIASESLAAYHKKNVGTV